MVFIIIKSENCSYTGDLPWMGMGMEWRWMYTSFVPQWDVGAIDQSTVAVYQVGDTVGHFRRRTRDQQRLHSTGHFDLHHGFAMTGVHTLTRILALAVRQHRLHLLDVAEIRHQNQLQIVKKITFMSLFLHKSFQTHSIQWISMLFLLKMTQFRCNSA